MEISIITALKRIRQDIINGNISTNAELAARLTKAMSIEAGDLRLPRYAPSEPPFSMKFNAIADQIARSLNDRRYVFDLLMAASIYDQDVAMRAIDDLEYRVLGLVDTVKSLYFFTRPAKAGMHIVNADFTLGMGVFSKESTVSRQTGAGVSLPIAEKIAEPSEPVCTGNGIAGNWFLDNAGKPMSLSIETYKTESLGDCNPSTVFEWEAFRIKPQVIEDTLGYGFGFADSEWKWATTDRSDIDLTATVTYSRPISTNYIVVTPAADFIEFTINKIVLQLNGVQVREVLPKGVIVNPQLLMHGESGYTNEGNFVFPATLCDEVIIEFRSDAYRPCMIRHVIKKDEDGNIIAGDSPPLGEPERYIKEQHGRDPSVAVKVSSADRFYIGLKDISVQQLTFSSQGYATSEEVTFDKSIDRLAVIMDADVPDGTSVKFQMTFNGGKSWYTINPVGTSVKNQLIAVNDMIPAAYQDPSTYYVVEENNPKSFIARMYLDREIGGDDLTPIVRSVEFEVTLKP